MSATTEASLRPAGVEFRPSQSASEKSWEL